jgi:hypothetical protein
MTPITYEQFGQQFIRQAVTPERIQDELTALLAEPIEGSVSKLPAEIIVGDYQFTLKSVEVKPVSEPPEDVRFLMRINGTLALKVRIVGLPLRFTLDVHIRLSQRVRTYAPAIIRLENREITRDDVSVDVDAHDVPGDLLDKLNIIEPAVRDQMVDEVNARIRSGAIAEACTIDVLRLAQGAVLGRAPPEAAHMQS